MGEIRVKGLDGQEVMVGAKAISELASRFRGEVIVPDAEGYEEARRVWNGMIDRRPGIIARCAGAADVIQAVNLAREYEILTSIRGGGHNVAGNAVNDGGLVIDLSGMRRVRADPAARTIRADGGATLGDLDREAQAFHMATPMGVVSRTGIAGLTLSGGFGWLTRKHGLTLDNLISADVVTADGRQVQASVEENPDLLWALRGGGGNFGVVTSFEYKLYPVGPEVMLTATFYPAEKASEGLRFFRRYMADAPDDLFALAIFWSLPEGPDFPADRAGEPVLVFVGMYTGPMSQAEEMVRPLRHFAQPIADVSGPVSWLDAQTFYDEDYPDGMLYYWKSIFLDELSDGAIDVLTAKAIDRPSRLSNVDVWYLGGAMGRVDPADTAFWRRDAQIMIGAEANWTEQEESAANIAWARDLIASLRPHSGGGSYLNFGGFGEEGNQLVRDAFGGNYRRLVEIKRKYDPDNLFRMNHNIPPTG